MSKESKAREHWKTMFKMFGPKSPEEIKAYREYISVAQGAGKSKIRRPRTVRKSLEETITSLLF